MLDKFFSWTTTGDGQREISFIEARPCCDCQHYRRLVDGSICRKHLMAVVPDMHVTYMERTGSCFEPTDQHIDPPPENG